MATSSQPDPRWEKGIIEGDAHTIEKFYQKILPEIRKMLGQRYKQIPEEYAHDIFSETIENVFIQLKEGKYKPMGKFEAYFMTIAKYEMHRMGKKYIRTHTNTYDIVDMEPAVAPNQEDVQLHEEILKGNFIKKALEILEDFSNQKCKQLIQRFYLTGEKLVDIAKSFKVTQKFIRVRRYRCMKYFRDLLSETEEFKQLSLYFKESLS